MISRTGRRKTLKPCKSAGCPWNAWTAGTRALCRRCRKNLDRSTTRPPSEPFQESPTAIEARYQAALAEIRRRPRDEPDLRWHSTLHGLKGWMS